MKIQSAAKDHVAINDGTTVTATLANDSTAFIIGLLTKQYSNPEMAFIRETCSNAYDAHVSAGTEEIPFNLHLPSTFSPYMEIRDFGTGLSKDFMLNRYTAVGDSTKRDDNNSIGGFGIGRLSFLIVTEQAAITSYYNGMKYAYTMRYDETGELVLSCTDERPTDEPNGLRIKFPVQVNRIESFRQAAQDYFKRVTSTLPNFTGDNLEIERTKYSYTGTGWGIRDNDTANELFAIMGNIAYPILTRTLKFDTRFADVVSVLDTKIDLFFDIGEVKPLPTRENLDMCEHTINALLDKLTVLKKELLIRVEQEVSGAKNLWLAHKAYEELLNSMSYGMRNTFIQMNIGYKGQSLSRLAWTITSPTREVPSGTVGPGGKPFMHKIPTLEFFSRRRAGYNSYKSTSWSRESSSILASHSDYLQHLFIYNDMPTGVRPTIDYNYPKTTTKVNLVTGPVEAWEEFKKQEIKKGFNRRNFLLASELLPKPKTPRVLRSSALIPMLKAGRSLPSTTGIKAACRDTVYKNYEGQKTYYVTASNYQLDSPDYNKMLELKGYVATGLLEPIDILVLNKNRQKLLVQEKNWVHFSEYVKVCPSAIDAKKKQVYKACYYAMKYTRLYKILQTGFTDYELTKLTRWSHGGRTAITKVESLKGRLLRENRKATLAVEDLRFLVDKLSKELESFRTDDVVGPIINTLLSNPNASASNKLEQIAKAFDINLDKLKSDAHRITRMEEILDEHRNSQIYIVTLHMTNRVGFDMEKLKKEIKNEH